MSAADTTAPLLTERRGGVLIVTLNRPEVRNALDSALIRGIADALDLLDRDPELQVAVLTGAGKGFCAGMDLGAFAGGDLMWEGDTGFMRIVAQPATKPVLAAVEGFAVGGGLEFALACDLIVAGSSAKLGIPEVKRSLVAAGGALRRIPERVGRGAALRLALTGDLIDGRRAYEIGLVDELAADGDALRTALALAERIAANGPLALGATKRLLGSQADWSEPEFWRRQEELRDPILASEDAHEGSLAFTEKRAPVWRGR